MTPAEACRRAAELIGERGHAKGVQVNKAGQLCWTGALATVLGAHWVSQTHFSGAFVTQQQYVELEKAAADYLGCPASEFNDRPETSAEDVILALKKVAEILDKHDAG